MGRVLDGIRLAGLVFLGDVLFLRKKSVLRFSAHEPVLASRSVPCGSPGITGYLFLLNIIQSCLHCFNESFNFLYLGLLL